MIHPVYNIFYQADVTESIVLIIRLCWI